MRTTLTLDDDLAEALKERARRADQSFNQVVNDILRRGLSPALAEVEPGYVVRPHRSGFRPDVEPLRLNQINDQVTARVPDELVDALDAAAAQLKHSRAEIIRRALERYLEDFQDLEIAMERLLDPADPVLDWDEVGDGLLDSDYAQRRTRTSASAPPRR